MSPYCTHDISIKDLQHNIPAFPLEPEILPVANGKGKERVRPGVGEPAGRYLVVGKLLASCLKTSGELEPGLQFLQQGSV